ncbi:MAG: FAD-dependent oxidoreductase [Fimbriimonadales bacterium]
MKELRTQVLVVGGGTGGCACAMALSAHRIATILTEETDWLGGQLTAQAVPPDEHRWIETQGCTRRYHAYRNAVRDYYRNYYPLSDSARHDPVLNPGGGLVSRLCHEPKVGVAVLNGMLAYPQMAGWLEVRYRRKPVGVLAEGDSLRAVQFLNLDTGEHELIYADYIVDATETGELLPLGRVEYVTGAEAQSETGEPHAKPQPEPHNMQAITWCMALGYDPDGDHTIDPPEQYTFWRTFQPPFWYGPLLGWVDVHPITLQPRTMSLFGEDGNFSLFRYRQIVEPSHFEPSVAPEAVTIVNWPQNDYFLAPVYEPADSAPNTGAQEAVPQPTTESGFLQASESARQLSLSLLYWLQTEAHRPDGGVGYPGLHLRPDITGTPDGLAKAPYIRESRRIRARFTVCEQHLSAECRPDAQYAEPFTDSVGVGHYRIDLHPSTGGDNYLDIDALPFQIPLGALMPVRVRNLLPACKNIGTTHITNGCYRLHPVEWNIGEAVGVLIAFCLTQRKEPHQVYETERLLREYQAWLDTHGIQRAWEAD